MGVEQVDLTNCDREQIHIPGQIQSHGFLIVLDEENIIQFVSDNLTKFIKNAGDNSIGQSITYIESLLEYPQQLDLISRLLNYGKANKSFDQANPTLIQINGTAFYLITATVGKYYLLEFEPADSGHSIDIERTLGYSLTQMLADKKLSKLLHNAAEQVKNIIQYDRVMIYRFAEDEHGEVVAESKNDNLESWLGLHYPASDIPKQARELYKRNLTRLVADVFSTPSKISTSKENDQPLDLTASQLRAVSPIHIQYLKNMGVASSFSISLIHKGELWGLIACHNYTPKFIDYKSRMSSKLIGQILSSALTFGQDEYDQETRELFKNHLDQLSRNLKKTISVEEALTQGSSTILDIVNADGAVLIYEKNRTRLGITPTDEQLDALLKWIESHDIRSFYNTTNLSADFPASEVYKDIASGLMLSVISKGLNEYVIWFKKEMLKTVTWAGNPEKPVAIAADGILHIEPRHSFTSWSQTVAGTSEQWNTEEIKSVNRLMEEVMYAINLKASTIRLFNEKLQQAYEELDTFSYTISHDLKNPLAAIKGYAQILTADESSDDVDKKMVQRIIERADKMNSLINSVLEYTHLGRQELKFEKINIAELVRGIIHDIEVGENVEITVGDLPDLFGEKVMLSQVFSNILINAIKYSQNASTSKINISGTDDGTEICYIISDNGIGIKETDIAAIFGLFNRMENVQKIEGTGVGLAIVKRIVEKHNGRIRVESELGKGSKFFVVFQKELMQQGAGQN